MKGVIICGGKGTRMGDDAPPKSLLIIGGKPLIQHHIEWFVKHGITDIIVLAGDKSKPIKAFLDSYPTPANIVFQVESFPLGTAGALKSAEPFLDCPFIVIYGDKMHDVRLDRMIEYHYSKPSVCTIAVHPTTHMHDSDLLDMDENGRIVAVYPKPHDPSQDYRNLTNICIYIMDPVCFRHITNGVFSDFARDVLPKLIVSERVYGYLTLEYMRDIGTPERLKEVNRDWAFGNIINFATQLPAIFLDRDGVIVKRKDGKLGDGNDIRTPDELELYPDAAASIKTINKSKYLAIIITNQPGIAKGLLTMDDLSRINKRIETLLGKEGAELDAIFTCPHHPEIGWPGENPLYKIDCDCRKPGPGLILQAAEQFNIDLSRSYMIGDTWRDIGAGRSAGTKTVALLRGDNDWKEGDKSDYVFDSLIDAICYILRKEGENAIPVR